MFEKCTECSASAQKIEVLQKQVNYLEEEARKSLALVAEKEKLIATSKQPKILDFVRAATFPFLALVVRISYQIYFRVKKRSEKDK